MPPANPHLAAVFFQLRGFFAGGAVLAKRRLAWAGGRIRARRESTRGACLIMLGDLRNDSDGTEGMGCILSQVEAWVCCINRSSELLKVINLRKLFWVGSPRLAGLPEFRYALANSRSISA